LAWLRMTITRGSEYLAWPRITLHPRQRIVCSVQDDTPGAEDHSRRSGWRYAGSNESFASLRMTRRRGSGSFAWLRTGTTPEAPECELGSGRHTGSRGSFAPLRMAPRGSNESFASLRMTLRWTSGFFRVARHDAGRPETCRGYARPAACHELGGAREFADALGLCRLRPGVVVMLERIREVGVAPDAGDSIGCRHDVSAGWAHAAACIDCRLLLTRGDQVQRRLALLRIDEPRIDVLDQVMERIAQER
jgi:hypothetical protein